MFPQLDFDTFLDKVNCNASTPRISLSGYFTQTVNVECSTPFGPAEVDAATLRVKIAGKDSGTVRTSCTSDVTSIALTAHADKPIQFQLPAIVEKSTIASRNPPAFFFLQSFRISLIDNALATRGNDENGNDEENAGDPLHRHAA